MVGRGTAWKTRKVFLFAGRRNGKKEIAWYIDGFCMRRHFFPFIILTAINIWLSEWISVTV